MEFQVVFNPKSYPKYWEVWSAKVIIKRKWFGKPVSTVEKQFDERFFNEDQANAYVAYWKTLRDFQNKVILINERTPFDPTF